MNSLKSFTKFLKDVDIFGSLIQFNYKRESTLKTQFGGILTITMTLLGIFLIYFFGKDIILKDKPFITYTRTITQGDSEIYLHQFPIMFKLTTPNGTLIPYERLLYLTADLLALDSEGRYQIISDVASILACNPERDFGIYKEFLTLKETRLPENILCLVPKDNSTKFFNDYGSTNSKSLYIKFMECNETLIENCAPKEERNGWLREFFIQTYFVDWFIDPLAYDDPSSMYLNSGSQRVTNELYTRKYYIMKKTNITTDTGLFFEELSTVQVRKLELTYIDIYTKERDPSIKYAVNWESMVLGEVYSRSYIKIFDILAKLGGLMNLILQAGKIICQNLSETSFYIQQAKELVNFDDYDDIPSQNNKTDKDNKSDLMDIDNLKVIIFNNPLKKSGSSISGNINPDNSISQDGNDNSYSKQIISIKEKKINTSLFLKDDSVIEDNKKINQIIKAEKEDPKKEKKEKNDKSSKNNNKFPMKNETNNVDTDFPLIHQEDKSICSVDNNIPVDKSLNKNNITNVNENNVIEISKIIISWFPFRRVI